MKNCIKNLKRGDKVVIRNCGAFNFLHTNGPLYSVRLVYVDGSPRVHLASEVIKIIKKK